jgi:hypothetical protein
MWRGTFIEGTWRPACDGNTTYAGEPIITGFRFYDLRHTLQHRWLDCGSHW